MTPVLIATTEAEFPAHEPSDAVADFEVGHHVALAWVLDRARRSVLLLDHGTVGRSCPGGHVEPGERLVEAAMRELCEETGLTMPPASDSPVSLARSVGCARLPGRDTVHWAAGFVFEVDADAPIAPEPGQRAAWFTVDALPTPRAPDVDVVLGRLAPPDPG